MPTMQRTGDVFVLTIGDNENRFTFDWMSEITECLDEVDATEGPRALVTTATGKFFSNGLDLDWLLANPDQASDYIDHVQALFARFLTGTVPTVAALQGHTFAAGALLALAHDVRLMRADRGFFCLPEVDIHIPFSPGMSALVQAKLTPDAAIIAMLQGRRFDGPGALEAGIVSGLHSDEQLLAAAVEYAGSLAGTAGRTLRTIRETMYRPAIELLSVPTVLDIPGLSG